MLTLEFFENRDVFTFATRIGLTVAGCLGFGFCKDRGREEENTQGNASKVGQEITGQLVYVQGAARCVCAGGNEASGMGDWWGSGRVSWRVRVRFYNREKQTCRRRFQEKIKMTTSGLRNYSLRSLTCGQKKWTGSSLDCKLNK
mgnify:CR=1 FL=1